MDRFKQECKLCDNLISVKNYKIIDVTKNDFDILLLNLTFINETQNVTCSMCYSKLFAALNFKSTCLYLDNIVTRYIDFENLKPVDLKEIYSKEKGCKQGGSVLDHEEICRLCLQPTSSYKLMQEVPVDGIQIFIPEISFELTPNPVICIKCHDALCAHSSFIKNCLEVENKRNMVPMDVEDLHLTNPFIKTEEIEIKFEPVDEQMLFEIPCDIEEVEEEERDSSVHSRYGLIDTEETDSLYDLDNLKRTSAELTAANYESKECIYETTSACRSADRESRYNNDLKVQRNKSKSVKKDKFKTPQLKHKNPSEMKMYKCDECTFITRHSASFINHRLRHRDPSEVKMYMCDVCDFETKYKMCLKTHQLRHKDPSEVRMYMCDVCDYKSIQKVNLHRHQLRHKNPSEVPTYKCDKCGFETKYKMCFKTHQLIHKEPSEVQKYTCDQCDYESINKGNLRVHRLRHKGAPQALKYECDECDYKSAQKGNLRRHQLIHKGPAELEMYRCDKCKFTTKHKSSLAQHVLTHRDPVELRMYKCANCKFTTKNRSSLAQHLLTHRDPAELPMYSCDQCDYKNYKKKNLKRHKLTHKDPSAVRM